MNVKNIIIGIQKEENDNINKLINIINDKNINVITVNQGDRIDIENNLYIDVLWPNKENLIDENSINNNSIVCKIVYNDFSILFTGDIEKIAEKEILKNSEIDLNAIILKAAHHGSNTSTTQEFLGKVNPQVILIEVGKNNKFGHPSPEILKRFEEFGAKVYRTDLDGEIIIKVEKDKVQVLKKIL